MRLLGLAAHYLGVYQDAYEQLTNAVALAKEKKVDHLVRFLGFVSARIDAQAQSQMTKAATLVATSRGKLPAGTRTRQGAASAPLAGDSTSWTAGDAGHPHGSHGHHGHHEAGGSDWGADAGGDSGGGGGDGGGGGGD